MKIINEVNNSNPIIEDIFLHGSCFNFYHILQAIFEDAEPYCDVNHVITKIGNKFYDITGEVTDTDSYSHIGTIWGEKSFYRNKKYYKKSNMYLIENKTKYIKKDDR